jgi:hypothetical protein
LISRKNIFLVSTFLLLFGKLFLYSSTWVGAVCDCWGGDVGYERIFLEEGGKEEAHLISSLILPSLGDTCTLSGPLERIHGITEIFQLSTERKGRFYQEGDQNKPQML